MVFFGSKQKKENENGTGKLLQKLALQGEKDGRMLAALMEAAEGQQVVWQQLSEAISARLAGLEEAVGLSEKRLRRQSESLEDLLEEWQEQQREREYVQAQLLEYERRERALLSLVDCSRGHFQLLKQRLLAESGLSEEQRAAWQQQLRMMDQEAATAMRRCGMEEVGSPGETVDYETCEVLDIRETDDAAQAGTIACVYRPGRMYQGRLLAKAQVSAYQGKKEEGETNDNRN